VIKQATYVTFYIEENGDTTKSKELIIVVVAMPVAHAGESKSDSDMRKVLSKYSNPATFISALVKVILCL